MMSRIVVVLVASFLSCAAALPYGKNSGVIELTKKNFAEQVFSTEHVWLVEFYAPWCGHCKSLAPEWEKAAKNLKGIVKVGAVNCDDEKELCGSMGVQGFPTIKLFPHTQKKSGKGVTKEPVDYQSARTAAAIAKFALDKLPNFVTSVSSKNEEKFLSSEPELAKVLLFTNKGATSNLYKALAIEFHHRLSLGEVRHSDKALVEKYSISDFPTLIVLTASGERVIYEEEMKQEPMFKFLSKYAKAGERPPPQDSDASEKKEKKSQPPPPPPPPEVVYDPREEVSTPEQFDSICTNTAKSCLIAVLDTVNTDAEQHESYLKTLEEVHQKNQKFFNVLWINGPQQPEFLRALNLYSGFPTLTILNHKKSSVVSYVGAFSASAINDFTGAVMRGAKRAYPINPFPTIVKAEPVEPVIEEPVAEADADAEAQEKPSKDEL